MPLDALGIFVAVAEQGSFIAASRRLCRVVCASPVYLAARGQPGTPADLARHDVILVSSVRPAAERWTFGEGKHAISVALEPRLAVSTVQAALDAAVAGGGIPRAHSYQSESPERSGDLRRILVGYEPPPIPIHVVHPARRYLPPKVRLFIDDAVSILRAKFGAEVN